MKTANGYTERSEVTEKHVVWYRQNPAGQIYYVGFSRRADAVRFAKGQGMNDGIGSPRAAGICGDEED